MPTIEFDYNGNVILIQCNEKDLMKDIISEYVTKANLELNSLYFLYTGNIIKEELTVDELISLEDKKRNKMTILVYFIEKEIDKNKV